MAQIRESDPEWDTLSVVLRPDSKDKVEMQVARDISRRMLEAVEHVPVVDVYERLVPESKRVSQRVDLIAWLVAYAGVEIQSLGLDGDELALLGSVKAAPDERWALLARYWPYLRTTGTGRSILRVAWELFGVEEINERSWKDISAHLWKISERGFYRDLLVDRANVQMTLVDNQVDPSTRSFCAPLGNYDWVRTIRCRSELDARSHALGEEPCVTVSLLDHLVEKSIQRDVDQGIVACTLAGLPESMVPSPEEVSWSLGRVSRRDDDEAFTSESALHSYLVDRLLACAGRSGMPVQVHVSEQVTVERLQVLARRHTAVRFAALYAGGADAFSLLRLGRTLPNVSLGLCDLWRIAPHLARQTLRDWWHGVPLHKLFAVGGNTTMVEAVCVQAMGVREQLASVLARDVAEGDLDEDDALLSMRRILHENARDYFGLAKSCDEPGTHV